ncbi:MAG: tripartite tricarboxylate transporter substrate binding protein [Betaproteobacteria bacterium]|nr:tripartite tricarboxylate transporter substrate binding protein [Betaproteobacteria bacterium]
MSRYLPSPIAACALLFAFAASAQPFPTRVITIIVNSEPGGGQDRIANALREDMAAILGQAVVLEHRIGAGGTTALAALKRAKPDGYTILITGSGPVTIAPLLYPLAYDPTRDFDFVHRVMDLYGIVAARASLPASTIKEYVALARQSPGKYTFGSSGIASPAHLFGERLKLLAGIDLLHVPFKGPPAAAASLLSGDIDVLLTSAPLIVPHAAVGKLRLLAVVGPRRVKAAPDVPTIGEAGFPELTLPGWFGFLAPKGVPKPALDMLDRAIGAAAATPKGREAIERLGADPISMSSGEFTAFHEKHIELWRGIIKQAGIKVE